MENDYSQLEIDTIVHDLLTYHRDKLKIDEVCMIEKIYGKVIDQKTRDIIIKLYDGVRDMPGE